MGHPVIYMIYSLITIVYWLFDYAKIPHNYMGVISPFSRLKLSFRAVTFLFRARACSSHFISHISSTNITTTSKLHPIYKQVHLQVRYIHTTSIVHPNYKERVQKIYKKSISPKMGGNFQKKKQRKISFHGLIFFCTNVPL